MVRNVPTLRQDLEFKARVLRRIRERLTARGALEVRTPALLPQTIAHPATMVFTVQPRAKDAPELLYLQPSPELAMRELVAGGSGEIFQICSAFRDEELDDTHDREFMLLEWYVPEMSYLELSEEVCRLVETIVPRRIQQFSCARLFADAYGVDLFTMNSEQLAELHKEYFPTEPGIARLISTGTCFDNLLNGCLRSITASSIVKIIDYPNFDPCYAQANPSGYVERFEIYLDGVEIANGYQEIQSKTDFLERFDLENGQRAAAGIEPLPIPRASDLPRCAGVAVGLDRIIPLARHEARSMGHSSPRSVGDVVRQ